MKISLDILMIPETKLDELFLDSQFPMDGFTPRYRIIVNADVGGIALSSREDTTSRQISFKNDDKILKKFF